MISAPVLKCHEQTHAHEISCEGLGKCFCALNILQFQCSTRPYMYFSDVAQSALNFAAEINNKLEGCSMKILWPSEAFSGALLLWAINFAKLWVLWEIPVVKSRIMFEVEFPLSSINRFCETSRILQCKLDGYRQGCGLKPFSPLTSVIEHVQEPKIFDALLLNVQRKYSIHGVLRWLWKAAGYG